MPKAPTPAPATVDIAQPRPSDPVVTDDDPVHKKWWFWVALIGGAAAVGAAIAVPVVLTAEPAAPTGATANASFE